MALYRTSRLFLNIYTYEYFLNKAEMKDLNLFTCIYLLPYMYLHELLSICNNVTKCLKL